MAIYWNNHHHLLHACRRVTGGVLWANMHLLFWLSLVPFTTAWMEEQGFAAVPTSVYGMLLLACAIAYTVLQMLIIRNAGPDSRLAQTIGSDMKGRASVTLYLAAIPLAFVRPVFSLTIFVVVAIIWLVPDKRIERALEQA